MSFLVLAILASVLVYKKERIKAWESKNRSWLSNFAYKLLGDPPARPFPVRPSPASFVPLRSLPLSSSNPRPPFGQRL